MDPEELDKLWAQKTKETLDNAEQFRQAQRAVQLCTMKHQVDHLFRCQEEVHHYLTLWARAKKGSDGWKGLY
jgi:hypothetical protein